MAATGGFTATSLWGQPIPKTRTSTGEDVDSEAVAVATIDRTEMLTVMARIPRILTVMTIPIVVANGTRP